MRYSALTISSVLLLSSCVSNSEKLESVDPAGSAAKLNDLNVTDADITKVSKEELPTISTEEVNAILEKNSVAAEVKEGIFAMQKGEHKEASKLFNTALLDDPANSYLHFLNGLNYLNMAASGDATSRDLALMGFRYAIVYDPSNVLAHKRLGYMHYQSKDYAKAQQSFAEVLLLQQPDVKSLYALAAASYYNHDLKTAYASITKAVSMAPNNPNVLKAAAMIAAALNQPLEVQNFRKKYVEVTQKNDPHLDNRLRQWMSTHNNPDIILASKDDDDDSDGGGDDGDSGGGDDGDSGGGNDDSGGDAPAMKGIGGGTAATPLAKRLPTKYNPKKPDTFVIDCAIMRVSEQGKTSKGTNILNSINIVFNPGTYTASRNWGNKGSNTRANNFTSGFGLQQPASAGYSLNIFNVSDNRIEIVARPTLLAAVGKISEFFAGTDLIANVSSATGSNSIERLPIGYRVIVTPVGSRKDKNGVLKIQFDVRVEGNSIASLQPFSGAASPGTSQYTQVNHSSVCTTVELAFGETILLAGIYDREDNSLTSGTPGLRDVPGLGLLFSQDTTESVRKSVVYMMTLRPTEKMQEDANMLNDGKRISPEVRELQLKNISWFSTVPNAAIIMKGLSSIYREFRTGDIPNIYWWHSDLGDKKISGGENNEISEAVKMMDS